MIDPTPAMSRAEPAAARRDGYSAASAVNIRARATRWDQDARTRAALDRLAERLAAGPALRRDVPPGYHLDITV
jgi:uncharacterized protein YjiS (DUF1127 family)